MDPHEDEDSEMAPPEKYHDEDVDPNEIDCDEPEIDLNGDVVVGAANGVAGPPDTMDDQDPALLYRILEESLPKQGNDATNRVLTQTEIQFKRDQAELTWDRVRRWLWAHPEIEHRQAAAYIRGQNDVTPLHLVCKFYNPPEDVVDALLEAAPDTASWIDSQGWIPLHHACANGASPNVLRILIEAFPEGKVHQDTQKRTPLHFYATRTTDSPAVMAENAALLSDTGAAELPDRGGMLPMHYACAFGTHIAVLEVLADASVASLTAVESHGRTPMHLAMVNAHRKSGPNVIEFLLDKPESKATVDARDQDGFLPLHLLAVGLKSYHSTDEGQTNVKKCLTMYLEAKPRAAADFLTAIQDLPDWLQDTVVVTRHVRDVLNEKIVQRFPTCILMLDGMVLLMLIFCFDTATRHHIEIRFSRSNEMAAAEDLLRVSNSTTRFLQEEDPPKDDTTVPESLLFVGATYFLLRELIQIASLISIESLSSWWNDPTNWLDMSVIFMVFYYSIMMVDDDFGLGETQFRSGVAFTQGILWVAVIVFLKSTLVDFAVFVGGVFYVVQRLVAFLIAVGVILFAFAQMFYFVYIETDVCTTRDPESEDDCRFPHCTFEESLLKVYTMMMGEIGDVNRYDTNLTAQFLYVFYAFLVVILLSNVLIAIVTDSYEVVQNDRASIVFWSNRLDFVAEMDAIAYAVKRRLCCLDDDLAGAGITGSHYRLSRSQQGGATRDGDKEETDGQAHSRQRNHYFREGWQYIMMLFDSSLYDDIDQIEVWAYNVFRVICIFFVIPLWLVLGAVTAGWLWPPQVREFLFVQKMTTVSRAEIEWQKLEQLRAVENSLKTLREEILLEMANDREEMVRMKAEVETVQGEVLSDLIQVKELMASLIGQ